MTRRARGWRQLLCGGIAVALLTGSGVTYAEPIAARPPSVAAMADQVAGFVAEASQRGRVPPGGVGAVGKWPAGATAESLAQAGHLPTAAATQVVTVAAPGGLGCETQPQPEDHHDDQ